MQDWLWRLKTMLRRKRIAAEKTEEMRAHLDMEIEAGLQRGLSLKEARRQARFRAGLLSEGLESTREELGVRWLNGFVGDFRHAFRALIRNRGFGTVAILVLAASVAVNTLIFFMLDGVVLRPLPYKSPERLVRIFDSNVGQPKFSVSLGRYLDYRAQSRSLDSIALYTGRDMELSSTEGHSKRLTGLNITSDYFSVLGKAPFLGRTFGVSDLHANIRNVIVSYPLWQEYFQSDPAIVGKTIRMNREPWTIIGVAPAGFQHVGGEYRSPPQGETVDIWMPLALLDAPEQALRAWHFCNAIARIRQGVTLAQARQELAIQAAAYSQRYADYGKWTARVEPLLSEVTGRSAQLVWLLMAAGGLVLLVACANIAGLCVARAVSRRKELSLRRALGANRWQLLRVGLAENLLVGVAGAMLGLLLARAGLPLLRTLLPTDFPRAHEIALTPAAALFAAAIAIATVLIAGLLPSGRAGSLQSQRVTGGRDSQKLRAFLVAGEVALAGLLCAGSLFLLRSYQQLGARDHGFNPAGVLTFQLSVPNNESTKPGEIARVYEHIRQNLTGIPGVTFAGASTNLPWSGYDENSGFDIVGDSDEENGKRGARYQAASPGYFEATGMRVVKGRLFDRAREVLGQPLTVIVNDALVRRYFGAREPVGAMADIFGAKRRIVGVVAGIKDNPADIDTKPGFWLPLGQVEFPAVFFAIRGNSADPAALTAAATTAVQAVDPQLAPAEIRTLQNRADSAMASRRFALWLFQAFAALALVLAAAGVYGLLSYIVQQRRKELSIRVALGANRSDLWRMILSDGLKMAAAGALGCLVLIPVGGSLLQSFLYNVKAFDLFTIAAAPAALLTVSFLASLGPARSATLSDPAAALRED
jgi:predicted permease